MSRRIEIELTSSREDGSWTWRAAGAREPRGTVDNAILPGGSKVGDVLRVEIDGYLDDLSVVAVVPPRAERAEPERLELKTSAPADQPLVTTALVRGERSDRDRGERSGRRRPERGREDRGPREGGDRRPRSDRDRDRNRRGPEGEARRERRPRDRDRDRDRDRSRDEGRHERPSRPAAPPVDLKPKPKRLRPGRTHRNALLEAVPAEQRPIAEQLLIGGIPAVRQAIDKQNEELKAAGKPEVNANGLLKVAEDLRPRAQAAVWRDRAEAAAASVDDLDLRDLRSVVNAAGDAGRDEEARALAAQLREALANRVEKEHAAWLADLAETVKAGRVVRALRLSSRPPKAGAPIPGDIATQLAEATAASLTEETGPDRWATVLDALAYSPVRRRVIPQSLPPKLTPELRSTIARLASRLPEIAHIFDIEPDPAAERAAARGGPAARRRQTRKPDETPKRPRGPRKPKAQGDTPPKPEAKSATKPEPTEATAAEPTATEPDAPEAATEAAEPTTDTTAPAAPSEPEATEPTAEAIASTEPATEAAAPAEPSEPEATEPVAEPSEPETAEQTAEAP
ncbi:MAG TPA: hypothetical protein VH479_25950, partial [Acidimicrobiales bacterium]